MKHSMGTLSRSNGCGVLLIGVITMVRGLFYLPVFIPPDYTIPALHNVLPCWMWPTLWLAVGVVALVSIGYRRARPVAFGLCVGLHALWAFLYLAAWVVGVSDRGFVTAWSYMAIVGLCLWGMIRFPSQIHSPNRKETSC